MVEASDHINTQATIAADTVPASMTACEHLMLGRNLGRLQQQMTVLVRSYELQLGYWQRQLMRQSVLLILERTRVNWGLVPLAGQVDVLSPTARVLSVAQTDALICRTGCQMDGDHWREGELCKRDSRACVSGTS
ncbi:MAG TPA: hypothetical protein PK347_06275 [Burkholderiaceae bacterium]|nr:hypothetical protein [Burkholderiaceae bacterium]